MTEPLLARLHAVTRVTRLPQMAAVRVCRRYFERAPGWVLLTTIGRKTGLPREVLLPCERFADGLYVISTYAWRSDWMRNLRREPAVRVTCAGWVVPARAEVIDDVAAKQALVSAHPFFPPAPFGVVNLVHRTVLRPLTVAFLRRWVRSRPVVVVRPATRP
jgi:deazaflavin-dependent oxidoreductase (nitroreductase family)